MRKKSLFVMVAGPVFCLAAVVFGQTAGQRGRPSSTVAAGPQTYATQRAILEDYCVDCHNDRARTGNLSLQALDVAKVGEHRKEWEKVVRKLRAGMMPPPGIDRPDKTAYVGFVTWLENELDRTATPYMPAPGLHRLNRTEYGNAIRDLLNIEVDVKELLPPDDESNGFDNIADVLRVSPSLLEQYLAAARKISAMAVGDPTFIPVTQVYRAPPDRAQDRHIEGLPLGTRGGLLIKDNFPLDAEYQINIVLLRNVLGYMKGLEWPHQIEIAVDGERVFLKPVGGDEDNRDSDANFATAADMIDGRFDGYNPSFATIKMPGLQKSGNVTLKRGIFAKDNKFFDWYQAIKRNTAKRSTVTIKLLDESGNPTMTWKLANAWPTKVSSSDLNASGNEVAVESIELAHEGLTIDNK